MTDVFISYARDDAGLVRPVRDALLGYGLDVFYDHLGGIHAGETFPDRIDQEVRRAKVVLGCWTDHALTREWVRIECGIAKDRDVLVAAEMAPMDAAAVPALFYYVNREPLHGFDPDAPPARWGSVLKAIAQTLDEWADARAAEAPEDGAIATTRAKAERLRRAYPDAPAPERGARASRLAAWRRRAPLAAGLLAAAAAGAAAFWMSGEGAPPEKLRAIAALDTCGGAEMLSFDLPNVGASGQDLARAFARERDFLEHVASPSETSWTTATGLTFSIRATDVRDDAVDYEMTVTGAGEPLLYTGAVIREGLAWVVPCG